MLNDENLTKENYVDMLYQRKLHLVTLESIIVCPCCQYLPCMLSITALVSNHILTNYIILTRLRGFLVISLYGHATLS